MRINPAAARQTARQMLDSQPPGEIWSTDTADESRDDLIAYLARAGADGSYGPNFEELADPLALHIPGVEARSASAIVEAAEELGITISGERRRGRSPVFALDGTSSLAGLLDVRGVALSLLSEYNVRDEVPPQEFTYAAQRIASSGTHMSGVQGALMRALTQR